MTNPDPNVASESVAYHLADGTPTLDPKKAVRVEITEKMKDGSERKTLMAKSQE